jgi:hypothetical protein
VFTRRHRTDRYRARYGPWAVVTGASSGIGRAVAAALAAAKFNLVLVARGRAELEKLSQELAAAHGIACRVVVLDLAQESSVPALLEETRTLDVGLLVASAGFGTSGPFLDSPLETELDMLAVNCRSLTALTWHFGRRLRDRGRGGIVLLSSIVAFQGVPWSAHYAATKAYVQSLAEGVGGELSTAGVDVLAAAPGPTGTGFAARAGMRMGKAMTPESLAGPILDALGRRRTVLPGFLSKLLVYSQATLPRWARVRIMGMVMKGMAKRAAG